MSACDVDRKPCRQEILFTIERQLKRKTWYGVAAERCALNSEPERGTKLLNELEIDEKHDSLGAEPGPPIVAASLSFLAQQSYHRHRKR